MNNYAVLWLTVEYKAKYISVVKKILQDEMGVVDLKRFSSGQFR